MNTHSGLAKTVGETKINHTYTTIYKNEHIKYLTLGEKIDTLLNNRKTELTPAMIEIFYIRLLPVTYQDWMSE